jgi:hypothetical protein
VPFGGSSPSCVAAYSLQSLQARAFAFDGTVSDLEPARSRRGAHPGPQVDLYVRFRVREWFRGGGAPYETVAMFAPAATQRGGLESPQGSSYGAGSRLLVSGEPRWGGKALKDQVAWGCGFTRYFDHKTAAAWRHAFAGTARPSGG